MKPEAITLEVRGRYGGGTTVWRCNGCTASCTGNDADGVERCAAKAIVKLASLLKSPEIVKRPKVLKEIADHFWTVTYKAEQS
jgi:hypothetical protein